MAENPDRNMNPSDSTGRVALSTAFKRSFDQLALDFADDEDHSRRSTASSSSPSHSHNSERAKRARSAGDNDTAGSSSTMTPNAAAEESMDMPDALRGSQALSSFSSSRVHTPSAMDDLTPALAHIPSSTQSQGPGQSTSHSSSRGNAPEPSSSALAGAGPSDDAFRLSMERYTVFDGHISALRSGADVPAERGASPFADLRVDTPELVSSEVANERRDATGSSSSTTIRPATANNVASQNPLRQFFTHQTRRGSASPSPSLPVTRNSGGDVRTSSLNPTSGARLDRDRAGSTMPESAPTNTASVIDLTAGPDTLIDLTTESEQEELSRVNRSYMPPRSATPAEAYLRAELRRFRVNATGREGLGRRSVFPSSPDVSANRSRDISPVGLRTSGASSTATSSRRPAENALSVPGSGPPIHTTAVASSRNVADNVSAGDFYPRAGSPGGEQLVQMLVNAAREELNVATRRRLERERALHADAHRLMDHSALHDASTISPFTEPPFLSPSHTLGHYSHYPPLVPVSRPPSPPSMMPGAFPYYPMYASGASGQPWPYVPAFLPASDGPGISMDSHSPSSSSGSSVSTATDAGPTSPTTLVPQLGTSRNADPIATLHGRSSMSQPTSSTTHTREPVPVTRSTVSTSAGGSLSPRVAGASSAPSPVRPRRIAAWEATSPPRPPPLPLPVSIAPAPHPLRRAASAQGDDTATATAAPSMSTPSPASATPPVPPTTQTEWDTAARGLVQRLEALVPELDMFINSSLTPTLVREMTQRLADLDTCLTTMIPVVINRARRNRMAASTSAPSQPPAVAPVAVTASTPVAMTASTSAVAPAGLSRETVPSTASTTATEAAQASQTSSAAASTRAQDGDRMDVDSSPAMAPSEYTAQDALQRLRNLVTAERDGLPVDHSDMRWFDYIESRARRRNWAMLEDGALTGSSSRDMQPAGTTRDTGLNTSSSVSPIPGLGTSSWRPARPVAIPVSTLARNGDAVTNSRSNNNASIFGTCAGSGSTTVPGAASSSTATAPAGQDTVRTATSAASVASPNTVISNEARNSPAISALRTWDRPPSVAAQSSRPAGDAAASRVPRPASMSQLHDRLVGVEATLAALDRFSSSGDRLPNRSGDRRDPYDELRDPALPDPFAAYPSTALWRRPTGRSDASHPHSWRNNPASGPRRRAPPLSPIDLDDSEEEVEGLFAAGALGNNQDSFAVDQDSQDSMEVDDPSSASAVQPPRPQTQLSVSNVVNDSDSARDSGNEILEGVGTRNPAVPPPSVSSRPTAGPHPSINLAAYHDGPFRDTLARTRAYSQIRRRLAVAAGAEEPLSASASSPRTSTHTSQRRLSHRDGAVQTLDDAPEPRWRVSRLANAANTSLPTATRDSTDLPLASGPLASGPLASGPLGSDSTASTVGGLSDRPPQHPSLSSQARARILARSLSSRPDMQNPNRARREAMERYREESLLHDWALEREFNRDVYAMPRWSDPQPPHDGNQRAQSRDRMARHEMLREAYRMPPDADWYGYMPVELEAYDGLFTLQTMLGSGRTRGTPESVVNSLPSGTYGEWAKPGETEERCPICFDDYQSSDPVLRLPNCSHWFHKPCLQEWLKNARTCPVCRSRVGTGNEPGFSMHPRTSASRASTSTTGGAPAVSRPRFSGALRMGHRAARAAHDHTHAGHRSAFSLAIPPAVPSPVSRPVAISIGPGTTVQSTHRIPTTVPSTGPRSGTPSTSVSTAVSGSNISTSATAGTLRTDVPGPSAAESSATSATPPAAESSGNNARGSTSTVRGILGRWSTFLPDLDDPWRLPGSN